MSELTEYLDGKGWKPRKYVASFWSHYVENHLIERAIATGNLDQEKVERGICFGMCIDWIRRVLHGKGNEMMTAADPKFFDWRIAKDEEEYAGEIMCQLDNRLRRIMGMLRLH
jgi:hypothetical protein